MNRQRLFECLALVALSVAPWTPAAAAEPLMCQVGATGVSGGPVPLTVFFQALTAGGNLPLAYDWDFGDGDSSNEADPAHTYTEVGIYQVVLIVTPSLGEACRDTSEAYVASVVDPLCWAVASETWSESADPIEFMAGPGLLGEPPPYEWIWSFGDGTTRVLESMDFQPPFAHGYADPGTYWAEVWLRTSMGLYPCYSTLRVTTLVPQTPVAVEEPAAVAALRLDPARPNPFADRTELSYALPRAGVVRLTILDVQGRRIATLADGLQSAGAHRVEWKGTSDDGRPVAAGVYTALLRDDSGTRSARVIRMP